MDFSNNSEWDINSWIAHTLNHSSTGVVTKPVQTDQTTSSVKSPSVSGSDPDSGVARRRNGVANGKITKRRSRASKRNTTTFITADPANFRRMVQQVTGLSVGNGQVPVAPLLKPEPQRLVNRVQGGWPTLDSSSFMAGYQYQPQPVVGPTYAGPLGGYAPATAVDGGGGGGGFGLESISSFPTLES
ncbi:hypothetical protein DCAR_0625748 [Daucus carota subsp. sativus]|uniref:Uncharacterized protein n=1 Tax=Daucus carota subsp. sativus TaxID=79200 RepID=A0A164WNF3_DAUCS|nr:PREDICTED: calmodulin-binding protein 25 [Daucus carota subsp. sativus]WOH06323.1 hypothetical protein DCAR_0625748 [Daucus carota subsp. sativus]